MSNSPLISICNATIFRGETCVFKNFDLEIEQKAPAVILGPNGSGKTTLLKVINREIYPARTDNSHVQILGRERWNVWDLRSQIGIVSHDLQMHYHSKTVGLDVVLSGFLSSIGIRGLLASKITPEQKNQAALIMAELGIDTLGKTPLRQMSTGQQRRCLLARALVHNPHTLILDEPTAGLDLAASFDYMTRIHDLARRGKNVVLVTHLLNEIPPDMDRIILLRAGKIVADGAKTDVLTEENLRLAYATDVRIAKVDGYYLAYPPS